MTKVNIELTVKEYKLLEEMLTQQFILHREIERDSDNIDFTEDVRICSKQETTEKGLLESLGINVRKIMDEFTEHEKRVQGIK